MAEPDRTPRLGDVVCYHASVRQDVWDPAQVEAWPAIVTAVLPPPAGAVLARLRLTVFRPYEKPLWDVTADHAEPPRPGHWSWLDGGR